MTLGELHELPWLQRAADATVARLTSLAERGDVRVPNVEDTWFMTTPGTDNGYDKRSL